MKENKTRTTATCVHCHTPLSDKDAHKEAEGWYCDLCYANTQDPTILDDQLSSEELSVLAKVLAEFERETKRDTFVYMTSGGYAIAEMFGYDDNWVDIELKWGVQSDVENRRHVEQYKLERAMLNNKTPVQEILGSLE